MTDAGVSVPEKKKWRPPPRRCKYEPCGITFQPTRVDKEFCCTRHRWLWWALARNRGAQVYEHLIRLRKLRKTPGGTKGILNEISHIVDQWIIDDRAAAAKRAKEKTNVSAHDHDAPKPASDAV